MISAMKQVRLGEWGSQRGSGGITLNQKSSLRDVFGAETRMINSADLGWENVQIEAKKVLRP